jgi:hypothetical protein
MKFFDVLVLFSTVKNYLKDKTMERWKDLFWLMVPVHQSIVGCLSCHEPVVRQKVMMEGHSRGNCLNLVKMSKQSGDQRLDTFFKACPQ